MAQGSMEEPFVFQIKEVEHHICHGHQLGKTLNPCPVLQKRAPLDLGQRRLAVLHHNQLTIQHRARRQPSQTTQLGELGSDVNELTTLETDAPCLDECQAPDSVPLDLKEIVR